MVTADALLSMAEDVASRLGGLDWTAVHIREPRMGVRVSRIGVRPDPHSPDLHSLDLHSLDLHMAEDAEPVALPWDEPTRISATTMTRRAQLGRWDVTEYRPLPAATEETQ